VLHFIYRHHRGVGEDDRAGGGRLRFDARFEEGSGGARAGGGEQFTAVECGQGHARTLASGSRQVKAARCEHWRGSGAVD
jgi:hypothetical protein